MEGGEGGGVGGRGRGISVLLCTKLILSSVRSFRSMTHFCQILTDFCQNSLGLFFLLKAAELFLTSFAFACRQPRTDIAIDVSLLRDDDFEK